MKVSVDASIRLHVSQSEALIKDACRSCHMPILGDIQTQQRLDPLHH